MAVLKLTSFSKVCQKLIALYVKYVSLNDRGYVTYLSVGRGGGLFIDGVISGLDISL